MEKPSHPTSPASFRHLGIGLLGLGVALLTHWLLNQLTSLPQSSWVFYIGFLLPAALSGGAAFGIASAVKSYRDHIGGFTLFFSLLVIYLYYFPYFIAIQIISSELGIIIPVAAAWAFSLIPASALSYAIHLYFYTWSVPFKPKLTIATSILALLYIGLPFLSLWFGLVVTS